MKSFYIAAFCTHYLVNVLLLKCLIWAGLFAEASARYLTSEDDPYQNISVALFSFALLFIAVEICQIISYQATSAFYDYITDTWNVIDMVTIGLVLASSYRLWTVTDPAAEPEEGVTHLLLWTGLFMFLELVSFLKKAFLPFAIFVSGTLKVRRIVIVYLLQY